MNSIDILISSITVLSCLISLMRGFTKEVISLVAWVVAGICAVYYAAPLALTYNILPNKMVATMVSFIVIFLLVLLIGHILNKTITLCIQKVGLGPFDKTTGIVFGFVRSVVIIIIAIYFAQMTTIEASAVWKSSQLLPYFIAVKNMAAQQSILDSGKVFLHDASLNALLSDAHAQ